MAYDYQKEKKLKIKAESDAIIHELPEWTHEFFSSYCRSVHEYSELTILAYATDIRIFFHYICDANPMFQNIKDITIDTLENMTTKDLQEYISYVSSYSLDGNTHTNSADGKNRKVASLRSFYKYFYTMGDIGTNPASILVAPKIKKKPIIALDHEETADLLETIDTQAGLTKTSAAWSKRSQYRDKAIIILMLCTGIRVSELVGISLKDISWKNNALKIVRKGGNEQVVYFNESARDALWNYIRYERKTPEDDVDALFVSKNNTRLTVRSVERMIKKYASVAVPEKHISAHKMRSSFATMYLDSEENPDIYTLADALGHSTLSMAQKYADISDRRRKSVSDKVDWV